MPLVDYFTDAQLRRPLPRRLRDQGWSRDVVDICWMDCDRPGYERVSEVLQRTLVLCRDHIEEFTNPRTSIDSWPWTPL